LPQGELIVAKHTFATFTTKLEFEELVEEAFLNYRTKGFPHYFLTPEEKFKNLTQLRNYSHSNLIVDGVIIQKMHGLSLAWCYFPHSWSVQCGSMKTPMQVFDSDVDFKRAIGKRLKYGTGRITDAAIRKAVRSFSGSQGVSNFRPTAAAAIYHTYLPPTGGTVWDMSSGYGGRLLVAIACDRVSRYIGSDPCAPTMAGLRTMARELGVTASTLNCTKWEVKTSCRTAIRSTSVSVRHHTSIRKSTVANRRRAMAGSQAESPGLTDSWVPRLITVGAASSLVAA
jgi:hypothetical protein